MAHHPAQPNRPLRICLFILLLPILLPCLIIAALIAGKRSKNFRRSEGVQDYTVPYESDLELHYFPLSLCSVRARLCLEEKGLEYSSVYADIGHFGSFDNLTPEFLRMNPNACVPALVHRGRPVLESRDIIEYIEREFDGPQLWPTAGTPEEAAMLEWNARGSMSKLGPDADGISLPTSLLALPLTAIDGPLMRLPTVLAAFAAHPMPGIIIIKFIGWFIGPLPLPKSMFVAAFDVLVTELDALETHLADGRAFLAGSDYSLADVTWTAHLDRLDVLGVLEEFLSERPRVRNYWEQLQARPSFAAACLAARNEDTLSMQICRDVSRERQELCRTLGARRAYGVKV